MNTVAFIVTNDEPSASAYYSMFPAEPVQPTGDLAVESIVPIGSVNAVKLLRGIAHYSPKNAVTVSHGNGGGLSIPLLPKSKRGLGQDETQTLNQCADGVLKDEEAASQLELTKSDVLQLKSAILDVRKCRLEKLVMRACFIGEFPETLEGLRHLVGARSACAPDVFDTFGVIDPGQPVSSAKFGEFIQSTSVIVDGNPPNRFAWDASIGVTVSLEVQAESQRAIPEWVARHFPKGKYRGSGRFAFHGLIASGNQLLFPLDQEYRKHLKFAGTGGNP